MMKKLYPILLLLLLLLARIETVNAQDLLFAIRAGSNSQASHGDEGRSIAVDDEGNIYVVGEANTGAIFGENQLNETVLSINGLFVAKYDSNGNLIWVQQAGSSNNSITGYAIQLDVDKNIYISGKFYQEAVFGIGQSNEILLSGTQGEIFIAKYDSNGQLVWAKSSGGENDDEGALGLVLDDMRNIYLTGAFRKTATFGIGGSNETTLSGRESEIFIAKYSKDGNLIWARKAGGDNSEVGKRISIDKDRNLYITGNYFYSTTFGEGLPNETTLNTLNESAYIAKYSSNGDFIWAVKPFNTTASDIGGDMKVDVDGNLIFIGSFFGTITLGAGTSNEMQIVGNGLDDIVIAKYNSNGDFIWGKGASSTADDRGLSIVTDKTGHIYATGYYGGDIVFGAGGRNAKALKSLGGGDIFLAKFSPNGDLDWATSAGSNGWDQGNDLFLDASGKIYVTGFYSGMATFGIEEINKTTLRLNGTRDIFISKFDNVSNVLRTEKGAERNKVNIYPNPFTDRLILDLNLKLPELVMIRIYNTNGRLVHSEKADIYIQSYYLDLSKLKEGVYLMNITSSSRVTNQKILKK